MYYLHYRTALTVELMQLPQGMWITLLKGTGCIKKKKEIKRKRNFQMGPKQTEPKLDQKVFK